MFLAVYLAEWRDQLKSLTDRQTNAVLNDSLCKWRSALAAAALHSLSTSLRSCGQALLTMTSLSTSASLTLDLLTPHGVTLSSQSSRSNSYWWTLSLTRTKSIHNFMLPQYFPLNGRKLTKIKNAHFYVNSGWTKFFVHFHCTPCIVYNHTCVIL